MNGKDYILYLLLVCMVVIIFSGQCGRGKVTVKTEFHTDTIVIRDTIRETVLVPQRVYISGVDSIFVEIPGDTVRVPIFIPIETKVYQTDDYRAEVEGYNAILKSLTLYPKTTVVTNTERIMQTRNRRFGLGVSAGYSYGKNGPSPYVGVGLNYNIIAF